MRTTVEQINQLIDKIEAFAQKMPASDQLEDFILQLSKLSYEWEEACAWAYIYYTLDTTDQEAVRVYEHLIQSSEKTEPLFFQIKQNFYQAKPDQSLAPEKYARFNRYIQTEIELYRDKNVPLWIEESNLSKEYQGIISSLTLKHNEQEYTLQQASKFLEETNRRTRQEIWEKIFAQIHQASQKINTLYTQQVKLRHQIANNAGFENFRDYTHVSKNRLDYTPEDCFAFHHAVEKKVVPLYNETLNQRKSDLKLDALKPFDLQVDNLGRPPLKPFTEERELTDKAISILEKLSPEIGAVLNNMKTRKLLDLSSRKNKAPGGYNYPLAKSGLSFIFMNAAGLHRDVITLLHEAGHAYQSFLTDSEKIFLYRSPCMEVAELASMSMELITMDYWDIFYPEASAAKKAKLDHLEDIIGILPWIAAVDSFQHWVYLNPDHSEQDRLKEWNKMMQRFSGNVDWKGYETYRTLSWMRQTHIFTSPFYYIEYGIAQLGALQIWRNYLENPALALKKYKNALALGSQKSMREIYAVAGIEFGFSEKLIAQLMDFIKNEMIKIHRGA